LVYFRDLKFTVILRRHGLY